MFSRRMYKNLGCATVSLAMVSLSFALLQGATASAAPLLATTYVATTGVNAPGCAQATPCKTISYALGQTAVAGTIHVAAGTYNEQVVVTQSVTIVGAGASQTVIEPSTLPVASTDSDSSQPQYAIVSVSPGAGTVNLSSLSVNGAAASNIFNAYGCADDFIGVYYHDASGTMTNDVVTNVVLPTGLFGCQDGLGVYVTTDVGSPGSVVAMTSITVTNYDKNGITCDDVGTICTISSSTVTGIGATGLIGQNGIQDWGGSMTVQNSTITGNSYTDPNYTGPGAYYASSSGILIFNGYYVQITGNTVTGNDENVYAGEDSDYAPAPPEGSWLINSNNLSNAVNNSGTAAGSVKVPFGSGVGDGLYLDSTTGSLLAVSNTLNNDPEYGAALFGTSGVAFYLSTASNDGIGIYLGGPGSVGATASNNAVVLNTTNNNAKYGILADVPTSSNSFIGNTAHGNTLGDVVDAATPANLWFRNVCSVSTPGALCGTVGLFG